MPESFPASGTPAPVMQGTPVPPEWRVPPAGYDMPPYNRWSFQNMRQLARTADIRRGDLVWDLPEGSAEGGDIAVPLASGTTTWAALLDATYTDATLIWKDGRVLHESYWTGMDRRRQHIVYSVSKSLSAVVAGSVIGDGLVDPAAPVTDYVPDFAGTAWNGATVQQVLDMTTGAVFDETYDSPTAHVWRLDVACGLRPAPADMIDPPATIRDLILSLTEREAEHGARFSYRSIETEVLTSVLEAATGRNFIALMSERLWAPMGAEEDAFVVVDDAGFALSDGGICTCLRDLARFGRLLLEDGRRDGRQIVPRAFVEDIRHGDHGLFDDSHPGFPNGRYRNMFWIPDRDRPAHLSLGIHGQHVWVDPERGLVAVKLSSWPTALSEDDHLLRWMAGVEAVVAAHG